MIRSVRCDPDNPRDDRDMEASMGTAAALDRPWDVIAPSEQAIPVVLASPHSGRSYPPEFVAASRLDLLTLRKSEDGFVDEIFATAARAQGAPLLRALFPRAYVDPNREPFELDPRMFGDELPLYVNTTSPRVAAGLGTIARLVASGDDIYERKLTFAEALRRIETLYRPYHRALRRLLDQTLDQFGRCLLIDCHSMPSVGGPLDSDAGRRRVHFVLGDYFGASCDPAVTAAAEGALKALGYAVARNAPYAGGFTTRHYGRPRAGVHTLQIEVNRALYMDEPTLERKPQMSELAAHMRELVAALARIGATVLKAR
jgi:N-formylglutamate amidohydrolase